VKVEVEAEGAPELCTASQPLSELLGVRHDSRPRILHALWQYIRTHKLQVHIVPVHLPTGPGRHGARLRGICV
jgi:hypothetical protein